MHKSVVLDDQQIDTDSVTGYPGNTTKEQDMKVEELQKELLKEGFSERIDFPSMLRFLRARKFDVHQAKTMFIECERWRKDFGVDDIVKTFCYHEKLDVFKFYPQYYHKEDREGRPIYIEHLGKINLHEMYKITTEERMLQNLVYEYEKFIDYRLPACSRKYGKLIETSCTIMDLKGVGISSISSVYGYVKRASAIGQARYPERMGKFYMINAPWGFSSAFRVIKLLLDPATVSKIYILGTNYKSTLLEQIPEENLPKTLGGTCECDGGCEFSDAGAWNDPQFIGLQNENIIQEINNNNVSKLIQGKTMQMEQNRFSVSSNDPSC
ncbi:phosphatidylinositol/phosphatidylcholine transfer protein SEC14 [Pneumocystis jirovecii RU7]|uniref:CRAL-TRIO domain-containing protein n=2 Tax=Pneumocystis jirovecii TaxID=42068 RepID=A0A0W4ZHV0_PNEJ7|nr:phosphatidylinositol/phosphatidylcholine transfer protein SEC14 [Pneumocystis jirovecii RU7]KTW27935.1 hypothetical protein T551_02902 [Pneumocystis jirovecii RU7]